MSKVLLHASASNPPQPSTNPLPTLLQTPSGLALLELQGTINLPESDDADSMTEEVRDALQETPIGRLAFPDYVEGGGDKWMKKVYLFVGKHQRLAGEVKKLPKAMAIIRKRARLEAADVDAEIQEELEVVEIIKYKIIFSSRPEPVATLLPST